MTHDAPNDLVPLDYAGADAKSFKARLPFIAFCISIVPFLTYGLAAVNGPVDPISYAIFLLSMLASPFNVVFAGVCRYYFRSDRRARIYCNIAIVISAIVTVTTVLLVTLLVYASLHGE